MLVIALFLRLVDDVVFVWERRLSSSPEAQFSLSSTTARIPPVTSTWPDWLASRTNSYLLFFKTERRESGKSSSNDELGATEQK
jgi:hypothetical protein